MTIYVRDIVARLPVVRLMGDGNRKVSRVVSMKDGSVTAESILWISDKNLGVI